MFTRQKAILAAMQDKSIESHKIAFKILLKLLLITGLPLANPVLNSCSCLLWQKKCNLLCNRPAIEKDQIAYSPRPSSMHCVLDLLLTSLCVHFVVSLEHPKSTQLTAAARFRQSERYYCSIFEQLILQNLRVKAQSGFRVNFKCCQRSLESNLLRVSTLSHNIRRQLSEP